MPAGVVSGLVEVAYGLQLRVPVVVGVLRHEIPVQ